MTGDEEQNKLHEYFKRTNCEMASLRKQILESKRLVLKTKMILAQADPIILDRNLKRR